MSQNLDKKPSRGILKTSKSMDTSEAPGTSKRSKEQRFDEMNIIETFHPANKKKPFTNSEKELIIKLVVKYASIIQCRKTGSSVNRRKNETWELITEEFNQSAFIQEQAQLKQIKKFWANYKAKARGRLTVENKRRMTGEGSGIPDIGPNDVAVLAVIPNTLPTIKTNDSDDYSDPDTDEDKVDIEEMIPAAKEVITPASERTSDGETAESERRTLRSPLHPECRMDSIKEKMVEEEREHRLKKQQLEIAHMQELHDMKKEEQAYKIKCAKLDYEIKLASFSKFSK